ncbi:hypothetical protein JCM3774_004558 [Rhodotorula dairenensis]
MATQPHVYGTGGSASAPGPVASTSQSSGGLAHRYQLPIPPHAPALFSSARTLSSNSSTNPHGNGHLASVPSMSVTDAIVPGPSHIAPMQTSIAPLDAHAADPEALKRERMAQHTKDLEAWVLGSTASPPPPPPPPPPPNAATRGAAAALSAIAAAVNAIEDVSDQDAEGEDDVDLDMVPAPAKRPRTSGSSTPASAATTTASARGRNGTSTIGPSANAAAGRPATVRKGKAGAIARKYLMETDAPASHEDFLTPSLPPLPHQIYTPSPSQLADPPTTSAAGPVAAAAKGKRKTTTGGGGASSRRASANGGGGGGGGGGAVTNGSGASTGTALVTSNHAPDGPEEPIVGPDPTPADLVALYPLQPRPPRPPRARPPRSGTSPGSSTPSTSAAAAVAAGSGAGAAKGPLLSAEQKKANHIASEQKRRAAIRKGYDGLCEVVPTLKAAVEEFEERVRKVAVTGAGSQSPAPAPAPVAVPAAAERASAGGKRQGRGKGGESTTGALMGGISVGGEKIDGRAGPKSEAVVLTQTVEHIRRLLADRTALLEKLSELHASAAAAGGRTLPLTGATREWDDRWDDGMREEMGIALVEEEWEDE